MWNQENNPFEALDLNPAEELQELTRILRERAETLPREERAAIQGLWQRLTLNPADRARYALLARPRLSAPRTPEAAARACPPPQAQHVSPEDLLGQVDVLDLLVPPPYSSSAPSPAWPDPDDFDDDPLYEQLDEEER